MANSSTTISELKEQFSQSWQKNQYEYFNHAKRGYEKMFSEYGIQINDTLEKASKLEYDRFYETNNAFLKLSQAFEIVSFLEELATAKNKDTEKIVITTLVSLAEAVYRINKPEETIVENLVKGFFGPVKDMLEYRIRGTAGRTSPYKDTFEAIEVLYLIRNDYMHNGNFTGVFFRSTDIAEGTLNQGSFHYSEKSCKMLLIEAHSLCDMTYREFLSIFLKAFKANIEKYISKTNINTP